MGFQLGLFLLPCFEFNNSKAKFHLAFYRSKILVVSRDKNDSIRGSHWIVVGNPSFWGFFLLRVGGAAHHKWAAVVAWFLVWNDAFTALVQSLPQSTIGWVPRERFTGIEENFTNAIEIKVLRRFESRLGAIPISDFRILISGGFWASEFRKSQKCWEIWTVTKLRFLTFSVACFLHLSSGSLHYSHNMAIMDKSDACSNRGCFLTSVASFSVNTAWQQSLAKVSQLFFLNFWWWTHIVLLIFIMSFVLL